jgi:hypothetical protein
LRFGHFFKGVPTRINFCVFDIKWIVSAVCGSEIPVDTTIRQVLLISSEERAFINELATKTAAVAISLSTFGNGLFNDLRLKRA